MKNPETEETLRTIHRTKRRQSNNITRKTKTLTNTEPMKTEGEPTCSLSTIFQLNFATIPTEWYDCVVRRVVRLCGTALFFILLLLNIYLTFNTLSMLYAIVFTVKWT